MKTPLEEELEDQILQAKINYLNGYLEALAFMSSYSVIGMNFKLFLYPFYAGDIDRTIQHNSYELFGVYPDQWKTELIKTDQWEERLKEELYLNFERGIPIESMDRIPKRDYSKNDLTSLMKNRFHAPIDYFVEVLKKEFVNKETDVYELKVTSDAHYRIIGIDLVFEIGLTKVLVLQLMGND